MKKTITTVLAAVAVMSASAINGLVPAGDALPYGWNLTGATIIPVDPQDGSLYQATLYLKANEDFKFLTAFNYESDEYGVAPDATISEDGTIAIAKGTGDNGYSKFQVAEDGNYSITINTQAMTAKIVKADYQDTQINYGAMFMVGSATPGEWNIGDGTIMYQNQNAPYEYKTMYQGLKPGSFKITVAPNGGFDSQYFYFRDKDDAAKMALNQDGDLQWELTTNTCEAVTANIADNTISYTKLPALYVIGDATPYGWNLADATAMPVDPENSSRFTGTLYLQGGKEFKFLTTYHWDYPELGTAPDATMDDKGTVALAFGRQDNGYGKLTVPEDANYSITIDTEAMTATLVKADYQATQIKYCSLYMVGSATPGAWVVDNGTIMYQDQSKPYQYATRYTNLSDGTFKICVALAGGNTWANQYYYYKSATEDGKMVLGQEGDNQWEVNAGRYVVTANTVDDTLEIKADNTLLLEPVVADDDTASYYNLQGMPVANPTPGLYLMRTANGVKKVYIR